MTRLSDRARAVLVLGSGGAALLAVVAGLPVAARFALTFWFVGLCPGLAWVGLLRLRDALAEWVLGAAFSLAAATFLAEALVLLRMWSPTAILVVLIAVSVPPCAIALRAERTQALLSEAA